MIASLKGETIGKLINSRIPGSRLLISSLPGSALKTHVESLGKPHDVSKRSQTFPSKLDIKRHSPSILYIDTSIKVVRDPCQKITLLLLKSKSVRVIVPESCF